MRHKCSSLALAMVALLVRLLGVLGFSWSLALFICGSLDSLRSWISTSHMLDTLYPPLSFLGASCVVSCACFCTYVVVVLPFVRPPALQLRVSDECSTLLSFCFVLGRVCAVPCLFVLAQPLVDPSSLSGAVLPHCCFSWAARLLRLGTRTSGLCMSFHLPSPTCKLLFGRLWLFSLPSLVT